MWGHFIAHIFGHCHSNHRLTYWSINASGDELMLDLFRDPAYAQIILPDTVF